MLASTRCRFVRYSTRVPCRTHFSITLFPLWKEHLCLVTVCDLQTAGQCSLPVSFCLSGSRKCQACCPVLRQGSCSRWCRAPAARRGMQNKQMGPRFRKSLPVFLHTSKGTSRSPAWPGVRHSAKRVAGADAAPPRAAEGKGSDQRPLGKGAGVLGAPG